MATLRFQLCGKAEVVVPAEEFEPSAELYEGQEFLWEKYLNRNAAVDDHGKTVVIDGRVPVKVFFPQEFLALVELSGRFEFIGWYYDFSFTAELKPEGRHVAILRKR